MIDRSKWRDIGHEQISGSSSEELLAELRRRALDEKQARELQGIKSELFCRETGRESEPFTTFWVSE